jgi:hypothetical protein
VVYHKTYETKFFLIAYGRNRVLFIERGLTYHKIEETDF